MNLMRISAGNYLAIALLCASASTAQDEMKIWYFGQNAGMDFTGGAPVNMGGNSMVQQEGCSSIADAAGNLLLYSNGMNVWDKNGVIMPNGIGLLGDNSSTQSALIIPRPANNCERYYVFTADGFGGADGLRWSEVDMLANGGNGDVIAATKNTLLVQPTDEKVTAGMHANGIDIWVLTHLHQTNTFHAYLVTASGVNPVPVVSTVGTTANPSNAFAGQMKVSPDGTRVAFCHNQAVLEVYDFDNATGQLSNALEFQTLLHNYDSMNNIYTGAAYHGIEFSPNSQVLYVSSWFPDQVKQYDLSAGTLAQIVSTQTILANGNNNYGMQLGTNGKIYIARPNSLSISVVNNPNVPGAGCGYTFNGYTLAGGTQCRVTFPGFVCDWMTGSYPGYPCGLAPPVAGFLASDTVICEGDCIGFTDQSTMAPTAWQWTFTGASPGSSAVQNPSNICYPAAGIYSVELIATNGSGSDTLVKNITVLTAPTVSLGNDTALCAPVLVLDAGNAGASYLWSTGATTQTIGATGNGTYWVQVDNGGCISSDTIDVILDAGPVANVTGGGSVCSGQSLTLSASGGDTYTWSTGSTAASISVAPDSSGVYFVTVSNACGSAVDSVFVTVIPGPTAYAGEDTTIALGGSVQLFGTQGTGYSWSPSTGLSCTDCQNPVASPAITTTYTLTVTDGSGCTATDEITVYVNAEQVIWLPNVFSPNGDGENDVLYVRGKGVKELRFIIYDRWGRPLFESDNISKGWDGTAKGKGVNPGVYVWHLTATFINGQEYENKGNVTLVK